MNIIIFCLTALLLFSGCVTKPAPETVSQSTKPLVLIEKGHSEYYIVIPDKYLPGVEPLLTEEAQRFSKILAEGCGVQLPVCKESDLPAGKVAIYVGDTAFARKNGVEASKLPSWHAVMKVCGNNLILAGCDRPSAKGVNKYAFNYELGSCRAITDFLKKYAGVRFLIPGDNGTHAPALNCLAVPENLNTVSRPPFEYCRTRPLPVFFETANNLLPSAKNWLYGGHSYYSAVPKEKYGKTNPEYFAMAGGGRIVYGGHLCLSNPNVQELVYQEMLNKLDAGYSMVELAQTDAYRKCECKPCENFTGVTDAGEQLWRFHRKLAERLYKERPDKKVLILAYGDTLHPPKTFDTFPPNTAIELCAYSQKIFEEWSKIKVPHGFSVYLYNWGSYSCMGVSPTCTLEFLEAQVRLLHTQDVRSIFLCGSPNMYGLEAPAFYAFYRMLENPSLPAVQAANEFYKAAFQETETQMRNFYNTIDSALKVNPVMYSSKAIQNPATLFPHVWNPAVLATMERELVTAEKMARSPKVKARLSLVRADFDFLKNTAKSLAFYQAYRLNPTWSNFDQLESAVEARRALIDQAFTKNAQSTSIPMKGWKNVKRFGYSTRAVVTQNGSLRGLIGAPFSWDFKLLREKKLLPCKDIMRLTVYRAEQSPKDFDFDAGIWAKAKWNMMDGIQLGTPSVATRFKVMYDAKNLYIAFDGERKNIREYRSVGKDGSCWGQDCFEILLDPYGSREKHYHFIFNGVPNSNYDSRYGFSNDPLDPNVHKADATWNGNWTYENRLLDKRWQAIVTIPFENFNAPVPNSGTIWTANFGREEYLDGVWLPELLLWAPNPEARAFNDRDKFGEICFE